MSKAKRVAIIDAIEDGDLILADAVVRSMLRL